MCHEVSKISLMMNDNCIDERLAIVSKWWFKLFLPALYRSLRLEYFDGGHFTIMKDDVIGIYGGKNHYIVKDCGSKYCAFNALMHELSATFINYGHKVIGLGESLPTIDEMKIQLMMNGI